MWISHALEITDSHYLSGGAVAAEYAAKLVAEGHPPRGKSSRLYTVIFCRDRCYIGEYIPLYIAHGELVVPFLAI